MIPLMGTGDPGVNGLCAANSAIQSEPEPVTTQLQSIGAATAQGMTQVLANRVQFFINVIIHRNHYLSWWVLLSRFTILKTK